MKIENKIYVDRTIKPSYPSWVKEVLHPELEMTGPNEFDVSNIELYLHEKQKDGYIAGTNIYNFFKEENMLKDMLSLRDLEEIQKKGITFFRKHFSGQFLFGWKSVVRRSDGYFSAPSLYENDGKVVLRWDWLERAWDGHDPSARFASPQNSGPSPSSVPESFALRLKNVEEKLAKIAEILQS